MNKYIIKRFLQVFPSLFLVTIIVFSIIHMIPGDPVRTMVGGTAASKKRMEEMRERLGLNRPLHVQYFDYLTDVLRGDLGISIQTQQPVAARIIRVFPHTIALTLSSMVFAVFFGLIIACLAATHVNTLIDSSAMFFVNIGISVPTFWSGLILIFLFANRLNLFPAFGADSIRSLVLPSVSLGFYAMATVARVTRSSLIEVLNKDYIVTARSKGLPYRKVLWKHAVRNSLSTTITIIGLLVGMFLGGAVITETVFSRPGIGKLLVDSIRVRDYPVVQGCFLVTVSVYLFVNLVVDILYAFLDPRIRY